MACVLTDDSPEGNVIEQGVYELESRVRPPRRSLESGRKSDGLMPGFVARPAKLPKAGAD